MVFVVLSATVRLLTRPGLIHHTEYLLAGVGNPRMGGCLLRGRSSIGNPVKIGPLRMSRSKN